MLKLEVILILLTFNGLLILKVEVKKLLRFSACKRELTFLDKDLQKSLNRFIFVRNKHSNHLSRMR